MALDQKLVQAALEEATKRPENLDFFLDHLTSPEWIAPLRERFLFTQPPAQFVDEERLVRAPAWAQSRYLARVARAAPADVREVIESIDTNNERVVEDFVDAALAMPVAEAKKTLRVLSRFLNQHGHLYYLLPQKIAELIIRFAAEDEPGAAISLMRVLFKPDAPGERDEYWRPSPRPRFSEWEYDKRLQRIVDEALPQFPEFFLSTMVQLLEHALRLIRSNPDDPDSEGSRVWRVRIGDDSERDRNVEQALTSALRDGAVEVRQRRLLDDDALVAVMTEFGGELYRRLAMYALSRGPEPELAVARRFVLDLGELTVFEPSPEFRDLLRRTAPSLNSKEIDPLIATIEAGPDLEGYRERAERYGDSTPTEADVSAYVARWQIGRFALLEKALPKETRAEYESLVAEYGPADLPLSWEVSTFYGPSSPLTTDELALMGDEELVAFLREWQPPADSFGGEPSIEGLARVFSALTEVEPSRIARLAPQLRDVKPAFIQWMVHGFEQAIGAGREFDWQPLLELLDWVVQQPREIEGGRGDEFAQDDPGWVWTRKAIAALLGRGAEAAGATRLPFEERDRVWKIIEVLARDPEPSAEYEHRDEGSNMDPATLALNTTRPRAVRAAISYAIWVYQEIFGTDNPSTTDFLGREAPEVSRLVEEHLRPEVDDSPAVRAVIGQFFANLFALDALWGYENMERVFPDENSPLREAGWSAYIIYTRPYTNVFELLHGTYVRSAELVGSGGHGFRWMSADPAESLGDHVAAFFWRGAIDLDDALVTTYWKNAAPEAREHVIESLGRWAREAELKPEIVDRLQQFWHFAKTHASGDDQTELKGFDWWFLAPGLPADWRLDELLALFDEDVRPRTGTLIAEELARLASQRPLKALRVLRSLIEGEDIWFPDASREHVERVLRIGYTSSDARTRSLAYDTVNLLLRKGYRHFANVVEQPALAAEEADH
jgi:hypothetical protein